MPFTRINAKEIVQQECDKDPEFEEYMKEAEKELQFCKEFGFKFPLQREDS